MNKELIMDNILQLLKLDDLEESEFKQLYNKNVKDVIQYIYEIENGEIIHEIEEYINEYSETDIWKMFKESVYSKTESFLATHAFRKLEKDKKITVIQSVFEWRYSKKETIDYIAEQINEETELVRSVFYLLSVCESLIIMQNVSQRRFLLFILNTLKFDRDIGIILWEIFNNNRNKLEKSILYNRISYINSRINNLEKQNEKLKDDMEFLCYMSIDKENPEE